MADRFYRTKQDALVIEAQQRVVEAAREWAKTRPIGHPDYNDALSALRRAVANLETQEKANEL